MIRFIWLLNRFCIFKWLHHWLRAAWISLKFMGSLGWFDKRTGSHVVHNHEFSKICRKMSPFWEFKFFTNLDALEKLKIQITVTLIFKKCPLPINCHRPSHQNLRKWIVMLLCIVLWSWKIIHTKNQKVH